LTIELTRKALSCVLRGAARGKEHHRLDRFVDAPGRHPTIVGWPVAVGEGRRHSWGEPRSTALPVGLLTKGRTISTHRKGKIVFAQGDDSDAIFYIKKGKVKVTVLSKQGKEAVVALLSEFFGEGCLIGQPRRLATATAMTDCVI
jgi:hypothetical protein